jgi:hypothetical protein
MFGADAWLLHLYLDAANPSSNKIIEGRADDTENKSHHAVDDWHKNSHPKHDTADQCGGRRLIGLGVLREGAEHPGEDEEGQEYQPHAAVNNGEHFFPAWSGAIRFIRRVIGGRVFPAGGR